MIPSRQPLRLGIIAALDASPVAWSSLNVLRRRRTLSPVGDEDDTTVVLTAERQHTGEWDALEQAITSLCRAYQQYSLRVELVDGSTLRCAPSESMIGRALGIHQIPTQVPGMGSSLGAAGVSSSTGTLGGYVDLERSGQPPVHAALTCHHVVRSTRREPGGITVYQPAVITPDPLLRVERPTSMDYQHVLRVFEDRIRQNKLVSH